ncbi:MAG: hypothetical protein LBB62_03795 [Proteiniphilum sp.]|jgi:hypothetical protein|nr:hypothetical protein [Proteiniphilum sp.]
MYKAIKLLKRHYYGNIALLAVVFLLILFRVIPLFTDGQAINVTAERYVIMISIIAIPVSLRFFARRLKKSPRPLETPAATHIYISASFLRLYTISGVTLMHIILFGIFRNMNFFWFTVVLFIVFLFCKPSYEELESLTVIPEEQKPAETSEEQKPVETPEEQQDLHEEEEK